MRRLHVRAGLGVALVALFVVVYFGAAAFVDEKAARTLETRLDGFIPFVPEAIFVYAWVYTGALLPLFTLRSDALLVRAALAYAIVLGIALGFYMALPVSAAALRVDTQSLDVRRFADWGVALVYRLDPPVNLFPSVHVALATVAALAARRAWPRYALAAIPWTLAIALSTCMTKQHYALDALAGALLGAGAYRLAMWRTISEPGDAGSRPPRRGALDCRLRDPLHDPPHYGWRGPLLQIGLYAALLSVAYRAFLAT